MRDVECDSKVHSRAGRAKYGDGNWQHNVGGAGTDTQVLRSFDHRRKRGKRALRRYRDRLRRDGGADKIEKAEARAEYGH